MEKFHALHRRYKKEWRTQFQEESKLVLTSVLTKARTKFVLLFAEQKGILAGYLECLGDIGPLLDVHIPRKKVERLVKRILNVRVAAIRIIALRSLVDELSKDNPDVSEKSMRVVRRTELKAIRKADDALRFASHLEPKKV